MAGEGRWRGATLEKAVAAAAGRFVVIVSSNKLVDRLLPPVPLELAQFGLASTLARLGNVRIRGAALSPDGGVIADYFGEFGDPEALSGEPVGRPRGDRARVLSRLDGRRGARRPG
jgi:ribose 5-phosphate isomerase